MVEEGEQCCCFCFNLRTGSYASAGYSIGLGAIGLIVACLGGVALLAAGGGGFSVMFFIIAAVYLLWIIFAILLIVGVQKDSRGYLIPWIVLTIILSVLLAIQIILALVNAGATFANGSSIVSFIINVVILLLNIYALWCVISLHRRNMAP